MVRVESNQRRWLVVYGTTLGILIALAVLTFLRLPSYRQPAVDFRAVPPGAFFNVHGLTRRQEGSLKLGYNETYTPPEIGIYGNHIVAFFGGEAFGRAEDPAYFFNFSYANLSLPEIHRYLLHIERLDHLPKKLLLVQITPPNADNGRFIIEWGNELPPDVLLSNLKGRELSANVLKAVGAAWELTNNWLHEVFNYNTLILGAIQGRSYEGRIVGPGLCQTDSADLTTRLPRTIQNIFGSFLGRRFYCRQNTWWNGLKRDGSRITVRIVTSSVQNNPALVLDENPLKESDRGLRAGDDVVIARHLHAINAVGRRKGVRIVFLVPPIYETDRRGSVVNRIFDRALALAPDIVVLDHRHLHADMSLFESSLHPSASYYSIVVDELRHAGLIGQSHR